MKKTMVDLLLIIAGGIIFAIAVNFYMIPNMLSEGGVIGITVVIHYLFGWSTGLVNFVLNVMLVAVGYRFFEKRSFYYTIFSIITSSIFLSVTEQYGRMLTDDTLLSAIFAGLLVGIGLGLIFRSGGSSGGSTVLARIANEYLGVSVGNAMLVIDIIVVSGSLFVIGIDKGMYTLISVYIGAKVIDFFTEGIDERVAVFIMSSCSEEIAETIIHKMSRGFTVLDGYGGYTGDNKKVLYLVINRQELAKLKKRIQEIDSTAYVTVHHVQEVIRKGFKAIV
ncbi:YitT family protein [Paraliobacillus salinarum]|uniref:YitT family protein n=1 Tax=Paraliobacillus salinarum TaxID=1158996 RepID=UPI0015F74F55|nr:YitT family protein [Paraliobacillus salinarum]